MRVSRSVLLIDDDPSFIRSLERLFERDGWQVFQAGSGSDGLELFGREDARGKLIWDLLR